MTSNFPGFGVGHARAVLVADFLKVPPTGTGDFSRR